jgi:hypothetical protein
VGELEIEKRVINIHIYIYICIFYHTYIVYGMYIMRDRGWGRKLDRRGYTNVY